MLRNDHVVVGNEDDVRTHFWPAYELNPLLDHCLSRFVGGMRLAGDDELHGELRIGEYLGQAIWVVEQERWTLVGCKAAREAQRQRVGIEGRPRLLPIFIQTARCGILVLQPLAYVLSQLFSVVGS